MVDPAGVAASSLAKAVGSIVTKQLQSKAGVRLGSRDERRQVYARFQQAVTEAYTMIAVVHLEQRLHTVWFRNGRWPVSYRPWAVNESTRRALAATRASQSEVLQAYLDLRLVANPAPLQAANHVLDRLNEVLETRIGTKLDEQAAATSRVAEAQREFVDVCRDDLWYLPKRWQVYRGAWWTSQRWVRRLLRKPLS
ncbi:hypothetical protein [Streptomyces tagetis]|uniref:Uncharacterized protein n=1 Tax=Streptomyces tagetis TaxID=2820809 RepID=A0A940XFQ1_9ACTN|nr:hypothetical protein [Streptomyces sp. RG38]MBQ0827491.1 hypothetical protein [Streptomyces sp. RG38]